MANQIKQVIVNNGGTEEVLKLTASQIISDAGVPGYTTIVPTAPAEDGTVVFVLPDEGQKYSLTNDGLTFRDSTGTITGFYPAAGPADYIVETGTTNGWDYRKYNSGDVDCWYTNDISNHSIATTWGNLYTSDNTIQPVTYPFTFVTPPYEDVSVVGTGWACWLYVPGGSGIENTVSTSGVYALMRPNAATITCKLNYKVHGRIAQP